MTDWLIVIALIILAFGIQCNSNEIYKLKKEVKKLKGGQDGTSKI